VKMVRPTCRECQGPDAPANWWANCGHDPYFTKKPHIKKVERYETELIDGVEREVLAGTDTRTYLVREPNITEVVVTARANDGRGVEKKQRYGFKQLPDIGYAPMCEMYGCGKAFPTVDTQYGVYCSENHAKLCVADILEIKFTINRPDIRRQEMAAINL